MNRPGWVNRECTATSYRVLVPLFARQNKYVLVPWVEMDRHLALFAKTDQNRRCSFFAVSVQTVYFRAVDERLPRYFVLPFLYPEKVRQVYGAVRRHSEGSRGRDPSPRWAD